MPFSLPGIKGDKLFDGNWGYDAAFRYSEIKNTETRNDVSASRFNRILDAADPIFDPTSPEFIGTTTPYNPFGDYRVPISSNAPLIAYAIVHRNEVDISKLATLDFNVYTTQLFTLPAGGVGFVFGAQFRRETLRQNPDTITRTDLIGVPATLDIGIPIIGPDPFTNGGRKTYAFYAEASLPIFSRENAIAGFHALELNVAGRFETWTNNDTNAAVPKVGLRWQPIDSFTIRGTWQRGFREPSLYELFASPTIGFTFPQTGPVIPPPFPSRIPVLFSSNPDLQPEDSHALNAGIEYTPKIVPGLTLAVDVWSVERTGVVQAPDVNQVLAREAQGILLPGEFVERDLAGNISRIGFTFQNAGQVRARGIDVGIQYQYQSPFGTFTSLTQATYLDSFRLQLTSFETVPSAAPTPEVGGTPVGQITGLGTGFMASTADDAYLKWKGRSSLEWKWNNFDILASVNYLSGFHEILFVAPFLPDKKKEHWVKHTWTFDLQGTYDFAFAPPVESQPVAGYSKDAKEVARERWQSSGDDPNGRLRNAVLEELGQQHEHHNWMQQRVWPGSTISLRRFRQRGWLPRLHLRLGRPVCLSSAREEVLTHGVPESPSTAAGEVQI
jgi:outer membrane receptor protein involved in Fe transport